MVNRIEITKRGSETADGQGTGVFPSGVAGRVVGVKHFGRGWVARRGWQPCQTEGGGVANVWERVANLMLVENVLDYWEKRRASNPELYLLATTVLAAPMTQSQC